VTTMPAWMEPHEDDFEDAPCPRCGGRVLQSSLPWWMEACIDDLCCCDANVVHEKQLGEPQDIVRAAPSAKLSRRGPKN
jgi:hypothetical protein